MFAFLLLVGGLLPLLMPVVQPDAGVGLLHAISEVDMRILVVEGHNGLSPWFSWRGGLPVLPSLIPSVLTQVQEIAWKLLKPGWVKVNVDGAFVEHTGEAGAGVIARDHTGQVILTAWRALFRCASAVEVEMLACLEGIRLAGEWVHAPIIYSLIAPVWSRRSRINNKTVRR
ncbi:hypothetical protein PR202_ga00238 [Eleusine coracana subsp. coracana]|uniref:RNase H type-1 domain-containing protein n=1 Tax=Eleusine coracana subsp. coracana TaxID=191504 RepID=A0AAV5BBR4_ELECO|nr:hypothetical protein PR202_ga00238 [Eleusine coracana subsp. coracana]